MKKSRTATAGDEGTATAGDRGHTAGNGGTLRPDLLMDDCQNRIVELHDALKMAFVAIEALIDGKPMLAAKVCGTTTLGNVRAEIKAVLHGR